MAAPAKGGTIYRQSHTTIRRVRSMYWVERVWGRGFDRFDWVDRSDAWLLHHQPLLVDWPFHSQARTALTTTTPTLNKHTHRQAERQNKNMAAASPSYAGDGGGGGQAAAAAWETCKENVMPLAAGRRVEKLNAVLKERWVEFCQSVCRFVVSLIFGGRRVSVCRCRLGGLDSIVSPIPIHPSHRPKGMRERRAGLEEQRAAFEARIAAAEEEGPDGEEDDDPLREWVR